MGKEDVCDLVPVHAGLDQVHQGARAKIEQNLLVRTHQVPGRSTRRMDVGSRPKNRQAHRSNLWTIRLRGRIQLLKNMLRFKQIRVEALPANLAVDRS